MRKNSRNVLLGVTGSIAAYKSPSLIRRLTAQGCTVRTILTACGAAFIGKMSLQAVSHHPVRSDLFDEQAEAGMSHIELAKWPDLFLIAPITANCIAKLAQGWADDLLSTTFLATTARTIAIAPAMNMHMWQHWAVQENVSRLREHGVIVYGPAWGQQACGDEGEGPMLDVDELAAAVIQQLG